MSIASMTGFARVNGSLQTDSENISWVWEIKSVNGKTAAKGLFPLCQCCALVVAQASEVGHNHVGVWLYRLGGVCGRKPHHLHLRSLPGLKPVEAVFKHDALAGLCAKPLCRFQVAVGVGLAALEILRCKYGVEHMLEFGVGGVDGLLHISEISWGKIKKPQDVLELEQKIIMDGLEVFILLGRMNFQNLLLQTFESEELVKASQEKTLIQEDTIFVQDLDH